MKQKIEWGMMRGSRGVGIISHLWKAGEVSATSMCGLVRSFDKICRESGRRCKKCERAIEK